MEPAPPGLEQCLELLKGERDEQRLAGLLLATKLCEKNDSGSILKVYHAVGVRFLDRLLKTGMGSGSVGDKGKDEHEDYLRIAVTVLSGFCRVPEIASSKDMVSKVPIVLEALSKSSLPSVAEECYEFLYLVATASDDGLTSFYDGQGLKIIAADISSYHDGSPLFEYAMKLLQLILSKVPLNAILIGHPSELACMVVVIAREFAVLHNAVKFDALHVLSLLLSSDFSVTLHNALRSIPGVTWATQIRVGIIAVLQNHVVSTEKLHALILAESMMSIFGEGWLVEPTKIPGCQDPIPADRCLFLVLESSRVEVAVLLIELAYMKYEASKNSSAISETIPLKQRNLAISYSLIEKIVKLIANLYGRKDSPINENASMKVISGLNETIGLVLDYLQDAKDHGQRKGDDLLASVRIIGSYLAETPSACKEKVSQLLEYILSVEGEDEQSSFYSVCFLLPMLCQRTMKIEGCKELTSFGGHKVVVECLEKLIRQESQMTEDNGPIFLACDVIINILLKREELQEQLGIAEFVPLLVALSDWTVSSNDFLVIMMAASICTLIFGLTSEKTLLDYPNFNLSILNNLSMLIARSLGTYGQEVHDCSTTEVDLYQIVTSGYASWSNRFPSVKWLVESCSQN